MREDQIHAAIKILRREVRQWQEPVVGVVARESARDPFRILISCLLSLRTKDKTTSEASARLFALAYTPAGLLKLSQRRIERAIYPVGFYRTKAKAIHAICRRLLQVYEGKVPQSIDFRGELPRHDTGKIYTRLLRSEYVHGSARDTGSAHATTAAARATTDAR